MHRLARVNVVNYRSVRSATLELSDFTALFGPNNAGKSNLMTAVAWVLRPGSLPSSDFHDCTKAVGVTAVVEGIDEQILQALGATHRTKIEPFCSAGRLTLRRVQKVPASGVKGLQLLVRDPAISNDGADGAWKENPTGIATAIQALFPEPILERFCMPRA